MLTFGNETKPKSQQNLTTNNNSNSNVNSISISKPNSHQNSNSVNKKPADLERLQLKYRKLEKENKRLKSIIEEMMSLSKNLQSSFEQTENFYNTINKYLKEKKDEDSVRENTNNNDNTSNQENKFKNKNSNSNSNENVNFTNNLKIDNFCYDIISSKFKNENENQNLVPSNVTNKNK